MDTDLFANGRDPSTYVSGLRNYRSFVRALADEAAAYLPRNGAEYVDRLAAAAAGPTAPLRATMMTEDWCGDSACNLPIIGALMDGAGIDFRVMRGSENEGLRDYYRDRGDVHIPVVSVWDREFDEIACWVEAPQTMNERKNAWKAANPKFAELHQRQHEDRQSAREFAVIYRDFLEAMAAWYRDGMWLETARELVEAVEKAGSGR